MREIVLDKNAYSYSSDSCTQAWPYRNRNRNHTVFYRILSLDRTLQYPRIRLDTVEYGTVRPG